jgi:IclR family pca regulon transcriptional regulator
VVAISVLDGPNVLYITRAEVTSVLRRSLTIGSRIPAFCTSMGRVLLAGLPRKTARLP